MSENVTAGAGAFQRIAGAALLCLGLLAPLGCADRRAEFLGGLVLERCDGSWPVCDTFAGCLVGPQSYVEGRFPNRGRFLVRIVEPSKVRVHVFLEEVGSAGEQAAITLYEDRCRQRARLEATGRAFVAEAERQGAFVREADLAGEGDHLVEFESDAQARYAIKVEVLPIRLAGQ